MRLRRAAALLVWAAGVARADSIDPVVAGEGCVPDASLYDGKYKLAEDAKLGGLAFLRPIRQMSGGVSDPNLRKGATFNVAALTAFVKKLQSDLSANSDQRIHISVIYMTFEGCTPAQGPSGELRVGVMIFDSSPSLSTARLFESRKAETVDPVGAVAPGIPKPMVTFTPRAEFNSSDHLFGGGRLNIQVPSGPISSVTMEGTGSRSGTNGDVDMSGERTWDDGWLQSVSWHIGYQRSDRPTGSALLTGSGAYGTVMAASQPLGASNTILRFGSELNGGSSQSDLKAGELAANTVASAADQTWKNAVGVSSRWGANAVAASWGLQLGRTNRGRTVDYYKQFADVAYSTYHVFKGHKLLEYETRFSAGSLKTPGVVPAAERFFGGNRENFLFSGPEFTDDWQVRANPFLRGISANQLNRVTTGAVSGGEGFMAWNNTLALPLPLINYPLLPDRVTDDPKFQHGLDVAHADNLSLLTVSYTTEDPGYKESVKKVPAVDAILVALRAIMEEVAASGGAGAVDAKSCSIAIRDQRAILEVASEAMDSVASESFGGAVIPTVRDCVTTVQAKQPDQRVPPLLLQLKDLGTEINALLDKVDTKKVKKQVDRDLGLATRVMNVFFHEASIVTVNPVMVFDMARLSGPATGEKLGVRYSVGGGLRMQFFRTLNLTAGYAANPRRRPGEKPGAVFFSLQLLNLFQ